MIGQGLFVKHNFFNSTHSFKIEQCYCSNSILRGAFEKNFLAKRVIQKSFLFSSTDAKS
jgi:hypothetical protein